MLMIIALLLGLICLIPFVKMVIVCTKPDEIAPDRVENLRMFSKIMLLKLNIKYLTLRGIIRAKLKGKKIYRCISCRGYFDAFSDIAETGLCKRCEKSSIENE